MSNLYELETSSELEMKGPNEIEMNNELETRTPNELEVTERWKRNSSELSVPVLVASTSTGISNVATTNTITWHERGGSEIRNKQLLRLLLLLPP